jgi:hypothetical protein
MISCRTQTVSSQSQSRPWLVVGVSCLLLAATSCQTLSSPRQTKEPLYFEVHWPLDEAKDLRPATPVLLGVEQVGTVTKVEQKFDVNASETRVFARLKTARQAEPLRVGDRVTWLPGGLDGRPCILITPEEGDRMQHRPIENGMLVRGETGSAEEEEENASGAWQTVKDKTNAFTNRTREFLRNLGRKPEEKEQE